MSSRDTHPSMHGEIVVVDDDTAQLRLVAEILTEAGHVVRPTTDGELALRTVRARLPDLILLDIKLPGIDGVEVCRRLKADPGTRHVPVMFMSSTGDPTMKVEALAAGGVDYVTKPANPSEFVARVDVHLKMGQLQRHLAHQTEELAKERALLSAIIENIPVLLTRYDPGTNLLYLNREFERVVGWSTEDLANIDLMAEVYPDPDYRREAAEYMLQADSAWREFRLQSRSGKMIPSEWANIRLEDGTQVGIGIDITDRKRAEEEMNDMANALEHVVEQRTDQLVTANGELEAFAYSVSHDLKAPLRAIDGYSAMLLEQHGSLLPAEGQRLLGVVRSNAKQMAHLIDDVLEITRIGRTDLVRADVDMGKLAEAVYSDLAAQECDRIVDFAIGELPILQGDPSLLRLIWTNLLGNALKFSAGRAVARIEVECREESEHWLFSVRDNGAGFDMQYADMLFGVFQRLHHAAEFPGTGVGLATVQRIIHRHKGEVWAEGEVDVGTTVFFRLPRSAEAE